MNDAHCFITCNLSLGYWSQVVNDCTGILLLNQVVQLGFDYVDDDPDPSPSSSFEDHGTLVAGVVAMVKGNDVCGVGVAFQSSLSGVDNEVHKNSHLTFYGLVQCSIVHSQ